MKEASEAVEVENRKKSGVIIPVHSWFDRADGKGFLDYSLHQWVINYSVLFQKLAYTEAPIASTFQEKLNKW